eukprot:766289-Hanusia_phi.AAC.7
MAGGAGVREDGAAAGGADDEEDSVSTVARPGKSRAEDAGPLDQPGGPAVPDDDQGFQYEGVASNAGQGRRRRSEGSEGRIAKDCEGRIAKVGLKGGRERGKEEEKGGQSDQRIEREERQG